MNADADRRSVDVARRTVRRLEAEVPVTDVVYVVLTVALFALLALVLRGVERL